jgi:hypothetical protein
MIDKAARLPNGKRRTAPCFVQLDLGIRRSPARGDEWRLELGDARFKRLGRRVAPA